MKAIQIIAVLLFAAIIIAPVAAFNLEEDAVSLIDNRMLADDPFSEGATGDLTKDIESYINDRIGFRDDMILAYTVLNDRLFHKMVHPSYIYGKDGYVFSKGMIKPQPYSEYHEAFADMVAQIQSYCEARDVPFLFVFEPAKPAVLTEYVPAGVNYDRAWVDRFFSALDERHVRYLDATGLLRERAEAGEVVFDQKYDANHWNDLGGYYVTNAMLEELKKDFPAIHVNTPEELTVSEELETSLPVSAFPIHEMVPVITVDMEVSMENTPKYDSELYRDPVQHTFGYYTNARRQAEGAPKALVFQGSHMNGRGRKYLANGFGEYVYIHNYQNVINFPYYFNIFQPDCVIFEVAEVTVINNYFNYKNMCAMDLNPPLQEAAESAQEHAQAVLEPEAVTAERGEALITIHWQTDAAAEHVWLCLDREFDMVPADGGYDVTVPVEQYDAAADSMEIAALQGGTMTVYR